MTNPKTSEVSAEQRATGFRIAMAWAANWHPPPLGEVIAQALAQESAREHERAEGLAKELEASKGHAARLEILWKGYEESDAGKATSAATARVAKLEKELAAVDDALLHVLAPTPEVLRPENLRPGRIHQLVVDLEERISLGVQKASHLQLDIDRVRLERESLRRERDDSVAAGAKLLGESEARVAELEKQLADKDDGLAKLLDEALKDLEALAPARSASVILRGRSALISVSRGLPNAQRLLLKVNLDSYGIALHLELCGTDGTHHGMCTTFVALKQQALATVPREK